MINPSAETCCGCSACESICAHKAITMEPDALGFLVANIHPELCVDCGLCDSVCPFLSKVSDDRKNNVPKAYAARHKDISEVATSRSGAVFISVSDYVLNHGGVVYGVSFDNAFVVRHQKANNKKGRDAFKGSKYVQSDLRGVWKDIRSELIDGKDVLFSGTPCQTAALLKFIPARLQQNLYVTDIICHGVASPAVWAEYLKWIERKEGSEIIAVDFRDKEIWGWDGLHRESFRMVNSQNKKTFPFTVYQPFLIRTSCHHCPYATLNRPSDLTIGDLWSWEKVCPELNSDKKGVSLVMCNTSKGEELLNAISSNIHIKPVNLSDCIQPNLQHPTPEDFRSQSFKSDFVNRGFNYILRKYYGYTLYNVLKHKIKRILGRY